MSLNYCTQNKIRLDPDGAEQVANKLAILRRDLGSSAIPEAFEESDETYKLIKGIRLLGENSNNTDCPCNGNDENERPPRKGSSDGGGGSSTNGINTKKSIDSSETGTKSNTKELQQQQQQPQQDSVFKSANWLSDSELIFSLSNQVGGLVRALRVFQELDIGIKHVESRPSKRRDSEFEIFVDIDCSDRDKMRKLVHHLR